MNYIVTMEKKVLVNCHYCGSPVVKLAKEVTRQIKKNAAHKWYCGQFCFNSERQLNYSTKWSACHSRARYKALRSLNFPKKCVCEQCGKVKYTRNIHIHHKDGNYTNNDYDNLQIVCVDCHPLADTLMRAARIRTEEKQGVMPF